MRTQAQSLQLAKQIHAKAGRQIIAACAGTTIPVSFVAGLVSVENARLAPAATRFELHVFLALQALRDGGRRSYNNITRRDVADATDAALRALATSYGLTQIMGWSVVKMLRCTIADLRDPDKHLDLAAKRLHIVAARQLAAADYASVLRIWNTGKPNGKTHDPDYVQNALAVMAAYERLPAIQVTPVITPVIASPVEPETSDLSNQLLARGTQAAVRGVNKATLLKGAKAAAPLIVGLSLPVKLALAAATLFVLYLLFKHRARLVPLAGTALLSLDLKGEG